MTKFIAKLGQEECEGEYIEGTPLSIKITIKGEVFSWVNKENTTFENHTLELLKTMPRFKLCKIGEEYQLVITAPLTKRTPEIDNLKHKIMFMLLTK